METSKSKSLKHRFAQFFLGSSRSFKQLPNNAKSNPNPNPTRPVIQITIDCSGRRSVDATPPTLRSKKKKERRLTETGLLYQTGACEGRICPPVSPSSPKSCANLNFLSKSERKGKEITHKLNLNQYGFSSSSSENEVEFFSSDKEKQELISSRSFSFSSDSSEFYRLRNKNNFMRCSKMQMEEEEEEEEEEKAKEEGFAVVKQSIDPYEDFRSSMMEMILEKKINGSDEMRKLLETYLELNSSEHHPIIVAAFADVWDTIFPKS